MCLTTLGSQDFLKTCVGIPWYKVFVGILSRRQEPLPAPHRSGLNHNMCDVDVKGQELGAPYRKGAELR